MNSDQLEYVNGDNCPESPPRGAIADVTAAAFGADDNGVGAVGVVQLVRAVFGQTSNSSSLSNSLETCQSMHTSESTLHMFYRLFIMH